MSEELQDELEAINSIYGEGCLVQSSDNEHIYVLTPPGESSSLRIEFPPGYPEEPPAVIGTNSTGESGKRGDAARELNLFRRALGTVYEPGIVCLFDAIEELTRLLEEEHQQQPEPHPEDAEVPATENGPTSATTTAAAATAPSEALLTREPPWILSDPFVELKSVFVGRCAKVASVEEAEAFVQHLLASDKKVRGATHNITAWRVRGPENTRTSFQDCDDDGETAAGGRLLHLMQLMDIWDAMIVVTRWYGGHKLGPRRFALINQTARDAFVKAGLVAEGGANGKKKGSGKG
ncbi:putative impact family protein [Eutypa lata UCREL1]|uniref:Putative impact family protein n=1 Tax=Eutypa lata (strain UCR-EL1) TaxID=1287681 RepID=M7T6P5_EUTLA|nr:putative impact family protein [Eutypa lata UCREL1]